jgi:pyridoxine kinase
MLIWVVVALVAMYRQEIVPLADIMTPNQFELELLTETKIKSTEDAWKAMDMLHERGVTAVVLTSLDTGTSTSCQEYEFELDRPVLCCRGR